MMLFSQRGFSILEAVITSAIVLVVILTFASLMSYQQKSFRFLSDKMEKVELHRNLIEFFSDSRACRNTLRGLPIPAVGAQVNLSDIKDNLNRTFIASGSSHGSLRIGQIEVTNVSVPGPDDAGMVAIEVPVIRTMLGGGVGEFKKITLNTTVFVDATSSVSSCTAGTVTEVCSAETTAPNTWGPWVQCPTPENATSFYCYAENTVWGFTGTLLLGYHNTNYVQFDKSVPRMRCNDSGAYSFPVRACVRCLN